MALNQGKYKPTICAIDEVDDRSYKLHTGQDDERIGHGNSKQQIEGSETAPLTTNQQKLHMDEAGLTPKELEAARKEALTEARAVGGVTPTANTPNSTHTSANGLRGKLEDIKRVSQSQVILLSYYKALHKHLLISGELSSISDKVIVF